MKASVALCLILLIGIASAGLSRAEKPTSHAWAATSPHGQVVFKMVPAAGDTSPPRPHRASASRMGWDGSFEELWSAEGWYAYEGFLSDDGRYFVCIGPGAEDAPGEADTLITFYDRGRPLRRHAITDVIKEAALPAPSAGPDRWRPKSQIEPNGFNEKAFHLVGPGGTVHVFDPVTGKHVGTCQDMYAQRIFELESERRQASYRKGEEMYAASSIKEAYDEHFTAGEFMAEDRFKTPNAGFEGPEWRGLLKPKKQHPGASVEVRAVFPWDQTGGIKATITPDEIEAAFRAAIAHPLVAKLIDAGTWPVLELRITGDRPHRDTAGLQHALSTLKVMKADPASTPPLAPHSWAEFMLRYSREDRRLFLNTQTGQLIELHESKPATLYDAKGLEVKVKAAP